MKWGCSCSFDKFPLCCSISELSRFQLCSKHITSSQWNAVPRSTKKTDSMSVYDYSMNLFMNDFWSALKTHFFHWHCPVPWNIISPRILTPCDGVCVRARVYHRVLNLMVLFLQSRFTFTETIRTIRDGEPRAATSTWSSEMLSGIGVWKCIMPPCGVNMHVLAWNWKWNWKFMRIVTFYFQSLIHPWGRSNAKSPQSL